MNRIYIFRRINIYLPLAWYSFQRVEWAKHLLERASDNLGQLYQSRSDNMTNMGTVES